MNNTLTFAHKINKAFILNKLTLRRVLIFSLAYAATLFNLLGGYLSLIYLIFFAHDFYFVYQWAQSFRTHPLLRKK